MTTHVSNLATERARRRRRRLHFKDDLQALAYAIEHFEALDALTDGALYVVADDIRLPVAEAVAILRELHRMRIERLENTR